jgi:hypothetical protein
MYMVMCSSGVMTPNLTRNNMSCCRTSHEYLERMFESVIYRHVEIVLHQHKQIQSNRFDV